jgi:dihydrofolate reductase
MVISIIAAIGNNRVIGNKNRLPWNLPADMEHFQKLTKGKPIIMGSLTFESIGKALPGRDNIVLARDPDYKAPGRADRMYLTIIEGDFEGDAFFPEFNMEEWGEKERIFYEADENNPYKYSFLTLERKSLKPETRIRILL